MSKKHNSDNQNIEHEDVMANDSGASDAAVPPEAILLDDGDDAQATIEQLKEELAHSQDQYLRLQADFDNYRKRTRREMEDQVKYAIVPLVRDLLDVLDNLNRAVESADQEKDSGLLQGVKLVADQLQAVLSERGVKKMDTVGQAFDPNFHESLRFIPSAEFAPGLIAEEVQPGYQLHERVVRPAKVFVAENK
ncbi:MAG TPA: nucleotide exchange factor GrpE [Pirellulaceae bacterium]|nr:nucleotide exchange factor GrpE [Pirellulaceae bacterium]HMO93626.1 nucleotide exchange factor GrpE [Pirellulaceae bacterium]HMP70498.1 nucleotide exchange factor GrpE [Pirellulaceae bacterium]